MAAAVSGAGGPAAGGPTAGGPAAGGPAAAAPCAACMQQQQHTHSRNSSNTSGDMSSKVSQLRVNLLHLCYGFYASGT